MPPENQEGVAGRDERESKTGPRTLQGDLAQLRGHLKSTATSAERLLHDVTDRDPYLTVGAAAGVGFLLGGGLPRGAVTLVVGVAARLAASWLSREILERAESWGSQSTEGPRDGAEVP